MGFVTPTSLFLSRVRPGGLLSAVTARLGYEGAAAAARAGGAGDVGFGTLMENVFWRPQQERKSIST